MAGAPRPLSDSGSAVPDEHPPPNARTINPPHNQSFEPRLDKPLKPPNEATRTTDPVSQAALDVGNPFLGRSSRSRAPQIAELFPALGNNRGPVRVRLRVVRPGFLVASLTLHAVVAGVVWQTAKDGLRPVTATSPSGLTAPGETAHGEIAEVELTPWQPPVATPNEDPANADVPSESPEQPRTDTPAAHSPNATATLPATRTRAIKPAAPESALPKPVTPKTPAPNARTAAPKPRSVTPPVEPKSAADDWLSIEQQLPDEPESTSASQPAATPQRDVLVERLLAKERDAQRLAAQDETRRRASMASRLPAAPSSARAPSSRDEAFGESRARADLWVELTRWLPRAASTDQAWERLPANSSYEFRVELTTENGVVVATRVLDRAPSSAERLLSQTAHLMSRGKYGGTRRVVHRFELRVRLTTTTGRDLWIAHTTPDPPKPGVGSFIAPSGRRFDVWVTQLP